MMTLEFFHKSYHADNVSYHAVTQFNKNKYVARQWWHMLLT